VLTRKAARALGAVLILLTGVAAPGEEITAVASRVNVDYVRVKQPDGSFQPESYAFGKGGYMSGDRSDATIDKMDFMEIARVVAGPLREQNYIPTRDGHATKLLIMVYWGTTWAPENASGSAVYQAAADNLRVIFAAGPGSSNAPATLPRGDSHDSQASTRMSLDQSNKELDALLPVQAENRMRDNMNARNAALLGYNSLWDNYAPFDHAGTALEHRVQDMKDELEQDRYFVILMAYDFQMMWKSKKQKLLWETRFSISEHHNAFDKQLASMVEDASKYFGQDSHGLVRKEVPEGHVDIGLLKSLGDVSGK
jgi:hypothetical protein